MFSLEVPRDGLLFLVASSPQRLFFASFQKLFEVVEKIWKERCSAHKTLSEMKVT